MKMTKTWMFITALLFTSPLLARLDASKAYYSSKYEKSDSGINGPRYEQMKDHMRELEMKYPQTAEVVSIGDTVRGVETYGLLLKDKNTAVKKVFMITGATHGNEYLNIADRLMDEMLNPQHAEFHEFYMRGGAFFIIPIFNPDGYTSDRRYNANGVDLNRDYDNLITQISRFTQPETNNADQWLENYLDQTGADLTVSMDYHCCYNGSLLFPWGYTKDRIPNTHRATFDEIGEMMLKHFHDSPRYGAVSEIIWYLADGTSHDYYYAKYGSLSMTYEGRYRTEKKELTAHVQWWKDIVARFGM